MRSIRQRVLSLIICVLCVIPWTVFGSFAASDSDLSIVSRITPSRVNLSFERISFVTYPGSSTSVQSFDGEEYGYSGSYTSATKSGTSYHSSSSTSGSLPFITRLDSGANISLNYYVSNIPAVGSGTGEFSLTVDLWLYAKLATASSSVSSEPDIDGMSLIVGGNTYPGTSVSARTFTFSVPAPVVSSATQIQVIVYFNTSNSNAQARANDYASGTTRKSGSGWFVFSSSELVWNYTPSPSDITNDYLKQILADTNNINLVISSIPGKLEQILDAVRNSQFEPSPSQSQAASDFKDQAGEMKDQIDQAQQEIDEISNRPPPESLVPTTPPIIVDGQIGGGDEVALSAVTGMSDLLSSQLILSTLILVCTLAFLSYVLFGKKG